jgi:leucyl aminopeptidase
LPLRVSASLEARSGEQALESLLADLVAGEGMPPDLIIVATTADGGAEPASAALADLLPVPAEGLLAAYGHAGQPGEVAESVVVIAGQVVRVLFLGLGDRSPAALRRAGAELGRRYCDGKSVVADLTGLTAEAVAAVAEGVLLGGYHFSLRSDPAGDEQAGDEPAAADGEPEAEQGVVSLLVADRQACERPLRQAEIMAGAVAVARDLANAPSAGKSPQWLATEAERLTSGHGVTVRIWPDEELAAAGFGGILAVGAGSVRPPRLIELSYQPAQAADSHIVLVGKGITFDSGGLSLKPNDSMMMMKTDMAGGGAVIAVMAALADLGVRSRVTGLVAAAENMPSGSAYRPGDVLSQYGGTTVEVLNTDAEGRLVLADALAYAVAQLAPDQIVDVATLTGAARVALGGSHAALYANCDSLAEALLAAGQCSGDRLWRMPLEDGYRPSLDSPVADLAHVARDHNPAGSILAALFLREFVAGIPWAHLDIAGPGRSSADDGERSKGATGFGTRVLLRWLAPATS